MPVTDQVGNLALRHGPFVGLRRPQMPFQGGSFEKWLSILAEDQPYLSAAENLRNRALFAELRGAVRTVIGEAELKALKTPAPDWFYSLLSSLHARKATVLTLNYDCLVEFGIADHVIWDPEMQQQVVPADILDDLPQGRQPARYDGSVADTFRLLKLHGSLWWFMAADDETGATLRRWEASGGFGDPPNIDEGARRRVLPDTEAFIVPPAATKSVYYRNPVTRELWQRAAGALRDADRLILIGYSLPVVDLTLTGMVAQGITNRDVTCIVVNPRPHADDVARRLCDLGGKSERTAQFQTRECVADFAHSYAYELARDLVTKLRSKRGIDGSTEGSLLVSWGEPEGMGPTILTVSDMSDPTDSDELILEVAPAGTALAPQPSQLGELIERLRDQRLKRLAVRTRAGRILPLIDLWSSVQPAGDKYRWISFTPAGRPDRP